MPSAAPARECADCLCALPVGWNGKKRGWRCDDCYDARRARQAAGKDGRPEDVEDSPAPARAEKFCPGCGGATGGWASKRLGHCTACWAKMQDGKKAESRAVPNESGAAVVVADSPREPELTPDPDPEPVRESIARRGEALAEAATSLELRRLRGEVESQAQVIDRLVDVTLASTDWAKLGAGLKYRIVMMCLEEAAHA